MIIRKAFKYKLKTTPERTYLPKIGWVCFFNKPIRSYSKHQSQSLKAKSSLNKSILDQGWSMFAGMLEYKHTWQGGKVIYVSPHHTSQTCLKCDHVSGDNRMSQSEFACTACR